jgi:tartrate dehydrogenase/decarboxylase/D-malate dehydrogenase
MDTRYYTIDVIAGDGIGREVVPAAIRCVNALASRCGFKITWRERDWGSDHYRQHGRMMPVDGIEALASGDAILLGAVGSPDIPDDRTLWGLLIPIRKEFDQYVNLRPIRMLPGVSSPLKSPEIDLVIVRENSEGEYSEIGGRALRGRAGEFAVQESVFTRAGVERVTRYAIEVANSRSQRLISATKSNGIVHTMTFWDEVALECAAGDPGMAYESVLVDALAARIVLNPRSVDVVVASNLFGDILSDLAAAVAGSIGLAPSANLNPPRKHPSMFEPVHGSAPDIAGRGIANPIGQVWAASMMLKHLGENRASELLVEAFEGALADGFRTVDLGGTSSTEDVSRAIIARCERSSDSGQER